MARKIMNNLVRRGETNEEKPRQNIEMESDIESL